jgi:predicted AAA+ superfamily ATPase
MEKYRRPVFETLHGRVLQERRFIQVLAGPRQVGKTTLARQLIEILSMPCHYVSADEPTLQDRTWLAQQWDLARVKTGTSQPRQEVLLVVDEVQKVEGWSETVKRLWDEDSAAGLPLKLVLLGSSSLLVQRRLTESLAGRFEVIPVAHWSYPEMRERFRTTLDQYLLFGGYPGAAPLIGDERRWSSYIRDSLIETTVSRDILLVNRVDKPALLRRLFGLVCEYSGQILSYQKMLGQLQDAGNTTTLAHYLDLLESAGLAVGLAKYAPGRVGRRGSSPKLLVLNTALMTAQGGPDLQALPQDPCAWGRVVETSVGAHLVNTSRDQQVEVLYWLDRNHEVDFVLCRGDAVVAIEVKSSARHHTLPGTEAFCKRFTVKRKLLVGGQGIPLEEFLSAPAGHWLE